MSHTTTFTVNEILRTSQPNTPSFRDPLCCIDFNLASKTATREIRTYEQGTVNPCKFSEGAHGRIQGTIFGNHF